MRKYIKETCSCGAILEFEEDVDYSYEQTIDDRQRRFHQAHEKCRKKNPPN